MSLMTWLRYGASVTIWAAHVVSASFLWIGPPGSVVNGVWTSDNLTFFGGEFEGDCPGFQESGLSECKPNGPSDYFVGRLSFERGSAATTVIGKPIFHRLGWASYDAVEAVAVDGNIVYAVGGTVQESKDAMVLAFASQDLTEKWAVRCGSNDYDAAYGLTVVQGGIVIAGYASGAAGCGGLELPSQGLTDAWGWALWSNGTTRWGSTWGGRGADVAYAAASSGAREAEAIYIVGEADGDAWFGDQKVQASRMVAFVLQVSPGSGDVIWITTLPRATSARAVTVSSDLHVAGYTDHHVRSHQAFVAQICLQSGAILKLRSTNTTNATYATSLTQSPSGTASVVGYTHNMMAGASGFESFLNPSIQSTFCCGAFIVGAHFLETCNVNGSLWWNAASQGVVAGHLSVSKTHKGVLVTVASGHEACMPKQGTGQEICMPHQGIHPM